MPLTKEQKRLQTLWNKISTMQTEAYEIRRALKGNCDHPDTREFSWEWDSGYGVQRMCKGLQCNFCLAKMYYPPNGNWVYPEDEWRREY